MTICVAWNATPEGGAALGLAVVEARRAGEPLLVVAVSRSDRFEVADTDDSARAESLRAQVADQVEALRQDGDPAAEVRVVPDGGDPAEAVLDAAVGDDASLLVIGVRRRSPVGKLLTGSTAQRIILDAPMPVLVTHATRS